MLWNAKNEEICMNDITLETNRLILRRFAEHDLEAIYLLFSDIEVNTFLPWYPVRDMHAAKHFYEQRIKEKKYCFAICLKENNYPIGYVHAEDDDSHDFGYALCKAYWHQGITSEACRAVLALLKEDGVPYITATHDRNNPRSGAVMKQIGMQYCYSYQEQWQPKNFPVIFRMYQLNFNGQENQVYQKYWNLSAVHFMETEMQLSV